MPVQIFFLFLLLLGLNSYSVSHAQPLLELKSLEFNAEYVPLIGEKVYVLKKDGNNSRRSEGIISGIKKNLDNTTYMLIEFKEKLPAGTPLFLDNKVIGMVYREISLARKQETESLIEAMPVKVALEFLKNLQALYPEAKETKKETKDAQPKPGDDKISAVKKYIETGNFDKAVKLLRDTLAIEPNNAELHGWMGIVLMEMDNPKEAVIEFNKALKIEPDNADFNNALGYAMLALESFDEAIKAFKTAIKFNPKHSDAHYGVGTAYTKLGETKLATREYSILKDLDSKMADSLFKLIMRGGASETE